MTQCKTGKFPKRTFQNIGAKRAIVCAIRGTEIAAHQGWMPVMVGARQALRGGRNLHKKEPIMRPYSAADGLVLLVLGVLVLSIHSITYFTTEHVAGPLGFFAWDVSRPHTIFINPIAGIVALAVGIALVILARRPRAI